MNATRADMDSHARRLAESGNRRLARAVVNRALQDGVIPPETAERLKNELDVTPPVHGFYFPYVDANAQGTERVVFTRVTLEETADAAAPALDASSRAAARAALDQAWKAAGAPGAPPGVDSLRLSVPPEGGVLVSGSSLWLAVYLAALSHAGRVEPGDAWFCTGAPGVALDHLDAKRSAAESEGHRLMALGAQNHGAHEEGAVLFLLDPEQAAARVFGMVPWAWEVARWVHVFTPGNEALPAEAARAEARLVPLGRKVEAGDLDQVWTEVQAALRGAARAFLTVAGPAMVAFHLGARLKNHPAEIRVVHARHPLGAWWSNRRNLADQVPSAREGAALGRVVLGQPRAPREGWFPVGPADFTSANVGPALVELVGRLRTGPEAHLALACPVAVAFAAGVVLRNATRPLTVHHFDGDHYVPWLTMDQAGPRPLP